MQILFCVVSTLFMAAQAPVPGPTAVTADVCVYGGTAAGMVAAVAASKAGCEVVLVEPSRWLGGMVGGGLRAGVDSEYPEDIGGLTKSLLAEDKRFGGETKHDQQPAFRGMFRRLAEQHRISVLYEHRLGSVRKTGNRIAFLVLDQAPPEPDGCPAAEAAKPDAARVSARVYIDASYEGDLLARAGVSYATGRESSAQYDESLAGVRNLRVFDVDPYMTPGDPASGLLPMIDPEPVGEMGSASRHTMAYNFRMQFVAAGEGIPLGGPSRDRREDYALVVRALQANRAFIGWPNGNYNRRTLVSSGIPGRQSDYAEADWPQRAAIWREWIDHAKIMHRLTGAQEELKPGEYADSADFPSQLYIRLARRMVGRYVMTQHDLAHETTIDDSVGLGFYFVDIYPCRLVAVDGKVATEGEVNELVSPGPYPISYRSLTPKEDECANLLVPVCISASHVALASIRMEPTYMIMGESAGIAAAQAVKEATNVQSIDMRRYEAALLAAGQKLRWGNHSYDGYRRGWLKYKQQQDLPMRPGESQQDQ